VGSSTRATRIHTSRSKQKITGSERLSPRPRGGQGSAGAASWEVYFKIELQNANVSEFHPYIGDPLGDRDSLLLQELELISFVFQRITITDTDGGTTSSDTWNASTT
jgi:hypothetical protein